MSIAFSTVGIDAGASLCKLAHQGETLVTCHHAAADIDAVRRQVAAWRPARIAATGGGAAGLGAELGGVPVRPVSEFEAWARGAPILATGEGIRLPERYLLVSLGTGTSVLAVSEGRSRRVGGSALGGGTLVGLGRLLLGVESFQEIADLAEHGDRRKVDLLVGDIYAEGQIPLHPQINAASFGKLASREPADLAHALMGMVGENLGIICAAIAHRTAVDTIVYCGSTLSRNPALRDIVGLVTRGLGRQACFLAQGAYCGAVGAASMAGDGHVTPPESDRSGGGGG